MTRPIPARDLRRLLAARRLAKASRAVAFLLPCDQPKTREGIAAEDAVIREYTEACRAYRAAAGLNRLP